MAIATMAIGEGSRSRVPALPLRVGPWMQDDILEHGGWVGWRACCVLAAAVRGGGACVRGRSGLDVWERDTDASPSNASGKTARGTHAVTFSPNVIIPQLRCVRGPANASASI